MFRNLPGRITSIIVLLILINISQVLVLPPAIARLERVGSQVDGTTILGIRHGSSVDHSRVVIDLKGKFDYRTFELSDPPRLVVDFDGAAASLSTREIPIGDPAIQRIRTGYFKPETFRVVIDLAKPAHSNIFTLKEPERLVIDLFPLPEEEPEKAKRIEESTKGPSEIDSSFHGAGIEESASRSAGEVKILFPSPGLRLSTKEIEVSGRGAPTGIVTLREPGGGRILKTFVAEGGDFRFGRVSLQEGENILRVNQLDPEGKIAFHQVPVFLDAPELIITIEKPGEGQLLPTSTVKVKGRVEGVIQVTLRQPRDGRVVEGEIDREGNFSFDPVLLKEGINSLIIKAVGRGGEVKEVSRKVTVDTEISLKISYPEDRAVVSTPKIPLVGETDLDSKVTLLVPATGEKRAIQADREGKFCFEAVSLFPGNNLLKLRSQDEIGNTAEQKLLVNFARKTIRRSIISLDLKGADLPSIIRGISQQGGLNVVISPKVQGKVTISLHNVTPREALTSILKIHGYDLLGEDGVLRVIKPEKVKFGSRLFSLKYIELDGLGEGEEQLLKQMSSFLSKEGRLEVNYRSNAVLVLDKPENLQAISRFIREMDELYKRTETRTRTRIFHLKNISLSDPALKEEARGFLGQVESLVSGEAELLINPDTNTLTISDNTRNLEIIEGFIRKMEARFQEVGEEIETRVFKLKYINLTEEEEEELKIHPYFEFVEEEDGGEGEGEETE